MKLSWTATRRCLLMVLCAVVLMLLLLTDPQSLFARAGGGGSFGGGGGGGFSGGGFRGGGFGNSGYRGGPIRGGGEPASLGMILVSLLLVFLFFWGFALVSQKLSRRSVRQKVRSAAVRQADLIRFKALQKIEVRDQQFDVKQFLVRVQTAFLKIQQAWSDQDLRSIRSFVSDGIMERFELQIQMMKDSGIRNVVEQVQVLSAQDSAVFCSEQFDTIHVRFVASAVDYNVDLKTGRKLSAYSGADEFAEYWTFHRRPGVKSLAAAGAIEGQCPRCAAPMSIVDTAKCPACGAQVNSGEYDWVLAEITQESEFQVPGTETDLPGVSALLQLDPGFSVQHVEDRVSVIFWRLRASEYYAVAKYAAAISHPDFIKEFSSLLKQRDRFSDDAAVGKVELIDASQDKQGNESLRVKVRWSGILKQRDGAGERVLRGKSIQTEVYTLFRKANVKTDPQGVFTSAGCPSCGAPLQVDARGSCQYCGAVVTDGSFDWVLINVGPFSNELAHQHIANLLKHRDDNPEQLAGGHAVDTPLAIAILVKAALIDGVIDLKERETIYQLAGHRGMSEAEVEDIIEQAHSLGTKIPKADNREQAFDYLRQLVHVFLADGVISGAERRMLLNYAVYEGIETSDVDAAIQAESVRVRAAAANVL